MDWLEIASAVLGSPGIHAIVSNQSLVYDSRKACKSIRKRISVGFPPLNVTSKTVLLSTFTWQRMHPASRIYYLCYFLTVRSLALFLRYVWELRLAFRDLWTIDEWLDQIPERLAGCLHKHLGVSLPTFPRVIANVCCFAAIVSPSDLLCWFEANTPWFVLPICTPLNVLGSIDIILLDFYLKWFWFGLPVSEMTWPLLLTNSPPEMRRCLPTLLIGDRTGRMDMLELYAHESAYMAFTRSRMTM